ncbi:twin-arginine translocation signal domain-containing protein [Nostoc sp.]|uniref:twin-arginine translocation signal domain-containing protein n=1 Tax=Nostoc sp. TaxID=1180 RepID=UPI002FFBEE42
MEISRRSLLKTASASGLVAAGLAVSEGFLQPSLAQAETGKPSFPLLPVPCKNCGFNDKSFTGHDITPS